ncbi:hypothetical protein LTR67_002042 [Exophiala xenobiotica]
MNPTRLDAFNNTSTSRPSANSRPMLRLRIGTGVDTLDFNKFANGRQQFSQNLIEHINGLIPPQYHTSNASSTTIHGAIATAITYINDTAPIALRRETLPQNIGWRERCRVIASLIPVSYFPTQGDVTHRFSHGLIRYLEDVWGKSHGVHPLPALVNVATSAVTKNRSRTLPSKSGQNASTPSSPGSTETSAIKIESDNEGNLVRSSKKRKKTKNTKRQVANSSSETPKKRKRKTEVLGNPEPPHKRRAALPADPRTNPSPLGLQNAQAPVVEVRRHDNVNMLTEQLRTGLEVSPAVGRLTQTSGDEITDEDSETESETSSEDDSEYENVRPSIESTSEVAAPRPPKSKKKPLNVYRTMYEEASEEIRFLQDLLTKGAGLTEADLKAAKIRVNNKMSYKYAFESVYNKDQEEQRPTKAHKPAKKKARITI